MNETGSVVFDSMSTFFDIIDEHSGEIRLCIIIVILLIAILSFLIQMKQLDNVSKRFNEGAIDDKTVKLCTRFRRRFIFPKSVELHDLFCCRLCSLHMERNEEDLFFDNINDIKKITVQTEWRLHLVLVAYLTKQRYLDWVEKYRATRVGEQPVSEWLKTQDVTYDADRLASAAKRITNPHALAVLKSLTEEV